MSFCLIRSLLIVSLIIGDVLYSVLQVHRFGSFSGVPPQSTVSIVGAPELSNAAAALDDEEMFPRSVSGEETTAVAVVHCCFSLSFLASRSLVCFRRGSDSTEVQLRSDFFLF